MRKDIPLFLFDIVMMATNGKLFSSRASHIPQFCNNSACCVWSANGNGSSTSGKFQGQYSKGRYLSIGLCNCNDVFRRTNRVRCALNKEILDLLNEESISEVHSGSTSL